MKSKIIDKSIAFVEVIGLLVSYYNEFYSQLNILTTEQGMRGKEVYAVVNDEEGEEDEEDEDEDEENFISIEEASEE